MLDNLFYYNMIILQDTFLWQHGVHQHKGCVWSGCWTRFTLVLLFCAYGPMNTLYSTNLLKTLNLLAIIKV